MSAGQILPAMRPPHENRGFDLNPVIAVLQGSPSVSDVLLRLVACIREKQHIRGFHKYLFYRRSPFIRDKSLEEFFFILFSARFMQVDVMFPPASVCKGGAMAPT